jgi:hypothetical protein
MKHITLHSLLLSFVFILLQACASGKVSSSNHHSSVPPQVPDLSTSPAPGESVYRNEIAVRAVRHFTSSYPDAQEERWYLINNGFMAKFSKDNVKIRIDYDKKGNWLYTIRYLTEKMLPRDVRAQVKSTWFDHNISSAEEIQVGYSFIYLLHINEGEDWKIIRVADGEMSEVIPPGRAG